MLCRGKYGITQYWGKIIEFIVKNLESILSFPSSSFYDDFCYFR